MNPRDEMLAYLFTCNILNDNKNKMKTITNENKMMMIIIELVF